jgi:hypothetical protein
MRARSFFHVCLGILALAAAYHLGARSATAQAPGNAIVGTGSIIDGNYTAWVVTTNGDVITQSGSSWRWHSNVFSGGPTPARQESMGAVKARYR